MLEVSVLKNVNISEQDLKIFQKLLESAVNQCKIGNLFQRS